MERFLFTLAEFPHLKLNSIQAFEVQADRFIAHLTVGAIRETLFDARDQGVLFYHPGPETKSGIGYVEEKLTGNESVFLEYHQDNATYHFVGSVNPQKHFKLIRLDRYQPGEGYSRVLLLSHQAVVRQVTSLLQTLDLSESDG